MTRLQTLAFTVTTILTTFAGTNVATAQYENVRSGMLLGIYASPQYGGLGVQGFIPGYTAQSVLQRGDVLMRATADGVNVYPIRSLHDMENMKSSIGSNRDTSLEVYRPGVGLTYCWVTFTPIYGPATAASPSGTVQSKAVFKSEAVKPGARSLFNKGTSQPGLGLPPATGPKPGFGGTPYPNPGHRPNGSKSAAGLFGRN